MVVSKKKAGRPPKAAGTKARDRGKPTGKVRATSKQPLQLLPPTPSANGWNDLVKPKWLTKFASELWDEHVDSVRQTGSFHFVDSHALGHMFQWLAHAITLEEKLKTGLIFKHPKNGTFLLKPQANMAIKAWAEFHKAASQFGFTLKSRQSLGVNLPNDGTGSGTKAGQNSAPADQRKAWIFNQASRSDEMAL